MVVIKFIGTKCSQKIVNVCAACIMKSLINRLHFTDRLQEDGQTTFLVQHYFGFVTFS